MRRKSAQQSRSLSDDLIPRKRLWNLSRKIRKSKKREKKTGTEKKGRGKKRQGKRRKQEQG